MSASKVSATFMQSIQDAENLGKHFDTLNVKSPPPPDLEVLKRAGLVLAMTAWETYVEDRVLEATEGRLRGLSDPSVAKLVLSKLAEEIAKLNSPTWERTTKLFAEYAAIDPSSAWHWNGFDENRVKEQLNSYMRLRGDVVHRSRAPVEGPPQPHPVKRDDLDKVVRFLRNLVDATETALATVASGA